MNHSETLKFIHSQSNFFCKPGTERIEKLCRALGNPQKSLRFVHVAGTNGKGSFCAFLTEILKSAGYKVGTFTSPFILRFNERIAINGEAISDDALCEIANKVRSVCEQMDDKPTEFEIITAIGFQYFKDMECDIVVLECGLGGRLDATNIIEVPLLSVITGVDFDHQNFLGDTIELIASEKAGIIKENRPVLWCGNNSAAEKIIIKEAETKNAALYKNKQNVKIKSADFSGTEFSFEEFNNIKISLLGSYQPKNASNVIMAAKILCGCGLNIDDADIINGLKNTTWPARFEKLSDSPLIIFDGSHNPEGVKAAVDSIKGYFGDRRVNILSGVMRDKNYSFIAKTIGEVASEVFTVTVDNPRSLSCEDYRKVFLENSVSATAFKSVAAAIQHHKQNYADIPLICVGSLYMYGEVYKVLKGL